MTDILKQTTSGFSNPAGLGWSDTPPVAPSLPTFSGSTVSLGNVLYNPLTKGYDFVGVVQAEVPFVSYTVEGTVKNIGDVVTIATNSLGFPTATAVYSYAGTYTENGVPVDVFTLLGNDPFDGNLSETGFAIAISPTNQAIPSGYNNTNAHTLNRTAYAECFLRGTMIATADGETAVEALRVGDLVATRSGDEIVLQAVTWLGNRQVHVRPAPMAQDVIPVRIRANAVRDGAPSRDLLVTPEHCLFIDGKFIPARMLVNGSSIISDTSITSYEYFHVELAQHAVLIAEGLETESYLDTGNRGNFANSEIASLTPDFAIDAKSWAENAAAPLTTDRETVEPIWTALSARAATLGFEAAQQGAIDNEPELRILAADGVEIRPASVDGTSYSFVVPADAGALRLLSRTFRPSDAIGPFVDDRRTLGVFVGKIGLTVDGVHSDVSAHLVDAELAGWHPLEGATRWTAGDALLPVAFAGATGPVTIEIEVVTLGLYRAATVATRVAA